MSNSQDLLFELGCEELPPKSLLKLSQALLSNVEAGLTELKLSYTSTHVYATPRRLAFIIKDLNDSQADQAIEKRGPAVQVAFVEAGKPSKAALGFAKSCGTTVDKLDRLTSDKGEWLVFRQVIKGLKTEQLIPAIIQKSIRLLPIAKKMRWGNRHIEFVRPVHWCVLLFGEKLIETEILGIKTDRQSQGHRFHAPHNIAIKSPDDYLLTLSNKAYVIADFAQRQTIIYDKAKAIAESVNGIAHIEDNLLAEITALNEWPVPVLGRFDVRFLELPVEVLITTMQVNQKYFPVKDETGQLLPYFITFSNIESSCPDSIRQGNERVILPRLADAEFFWSQDRKQRLADRVGRLEHIVFQKTLGSLAEKTQRVENLAAHIAIHLKADVALAKRAAHLAKADLTTAMVAEFASLQGVMGRCYALADNEPQEVAIAIEEQYFPKQSGGALCTSVTGQILSMAEKIDTVTGIFSVGLIPTGDKDPYALRRATLGLLRIIIENKLDLDILELIDFSLAQFSHRFEQEKTRQLLINFIFERLKGYCLEQRYTIAEFEAVRAINPSQPFDFMQRLQAVQTFRQLPESKSLAAANKRINNMLKKSDYGLPDSVTAIENSQELELLKAAESAENDIKPLLEQKDYQSALTRLAGLKNVVDAFFDHVMVNTDDRAKRANRLALLSKLSKQFLKIADISKLQ